MPMRLRRTHGALSRFGSSGRAVGRLIAVAVLLALVFILALYLLRRHQDSEQDSKPLAANVVVILVDTLRADHLSLYGYTRATSPNFDRRAARGGVVFESARAQSPCTFPSVNSVLTSRSPLAFVHDAETQVFEIPALIPSLSTILSAAGYSTAAVSASPIVRATPSQENPDGGFGAGFDHFDEQCYWGNAACVTSRALESLATLREPFLLYLHYLDPHDPYHPPKGKRWFAGEVPSGANSGFLERGDPNPVAARLYEEKKEAGLSKDEVGYLVDRYDDEIRFWDTEVEVVLEKLQRSGLAERTLVIVTADHGEEFLEHGHIKHCRTLFDTELRIPFVVFAPGVPARRLSEPVANLDLVPTVLDILKVGAGGAVLEGTSLRPLVTGRRDTLSREYPVQRAWWGGARSVSDGRFKLILSGEDRNGELFALANDPGETRDVAATERRALSRLGDAMVRWKHRDPEPHEGRSNEVERKLRSLGYLQ